MDAVVDKQEQYSQRIAFSTWNSGGDSRRYR